MEGVEKEDWKWKIRNWVMKRYLFFRFGIYDEMKNIDISILDRVAKGKQKYSSWLQSFEKKVISNLGE